MATSARDCKGRALCVNQDRQIQQNKQGEQARIYPSIKTLPSLLEFQRLSPLSLYKALPPSFCPFWNRLSPSSCDPASICPYPKPHPPHIQQLKKMQSRNLGCVCDIFQHLLRAKALGVLHPDVLWSVVQALVVSEKKEANRGWGGAERNHRAWNSIQSVPKANSGSSLLGADTQPCQSTALPHAP